MNGNRLDTGNFFDKTKIANLSKKPKKKRKPKNITEEKPPVEMMEIKHGYQAKKLPPSPPKKKIQNDNLVSESITSFESFSEFENSDSNREDILDSQESFLLEKSENEKRSSDLPKGIPPIKEQNDDKNDQEEMKRGTSAPTRGGRRAPVSEIYSRGGRGSPQFFSNNNKKIESSSTKPNDEKSKINSQASGSFFDELKSKGFGAGFLKPVNLNNTSAGENKPKEDKDNDFIAALSDELHKRRQSIKVESSSESSGDWSDEDKSSLGI